MVNVIHLLGRVGKDATTKRFDSGGLITEFSLATDDSYKDKSGNKVEQTDWHNCKVTIPKLAEVAEKYIKKGQLLYVEGKVKYRSFDDKNGNKRYVTEIIVHSFKMLGGKDKEDNSATIQANQERGIAESGYTTRDGITTQDDSELPFALLALLSLGSLIQYVV